MLKLQQRKVEQNLNKLLHKYIYSLWIISHEHIIIYYNCFYVLSNN